MDFTTDGDSVIALGTIGTTAHRLIRLTQDGTIESTSDVHRRDEALWSPRLFPISEHDELRLAGTPAESSQFADGLMTVRLTADGTPQWSHTHGTGSNPFFVRSNGEMLAATVSYSGTPSGVIVVDADGLRYHRRIPDHAIFDFCWIGDRNQNLLVAGKLDTQPPELGFVARLDLGGDPRWWRTFPIPDQSTTFTSIIRCEEAYRIQSIADLATEDGDHDVELIIDSAGEVQRFDAYPSAVSGGTFGRGHVFVTDSGDDPQLRQYQDMNRPQQGDNS